ncbi:MAG: DMT family transporter [Ahrensia sp.]|nr:DMT family transporter [Ahrensia sp.]
MNSQTDMSATSGQRKRAFLILLIMPLFFSSNMVFGRAAIQLGAEPFTLAFLRWSLAAAILAPFVWGDIKSASIDWKTLWKPLTLMGFLGMWVCGALVYLALKYTTATNGTLIYTSSPVIIILIERVLRGRVISALEALGILLAIVGVVSIVVRGSLDILLSLSFNAGDLLFVVASVSWAVYSFLLRGEEFQALPTMPLFALIAAFGAAILAPFAAAETVVTQSAPTGALLWANIAGIILFSSLIAFSSYNHGVKVLGSSLAGIFLYLLPIYGVALAVILLGEEVFAYHVWGSMLVLGGVVLATFPRDRKGHPKH